MLIFWKKNCKSRLSVGGSAHETPFASGGWDLPPDPHVVTPAYYYNFVEIVSSAKMRFITLLKDQNNYSIRSAFASSALMHLFFTSNSVVFVDGESKNVSCPRAQGNPSYATD